jgi:hypothetical protein
LRSTYRFGFAGVPHALNFELNLLKLLEVALVPASWRVVLDFSSEECLFSTALGLLRAWACCVGSLSGETPSPPSPLRSASRLHLAFLCA